MNPMNRREFLSVFGGTAAMSMAIPTFAATVATDKAATSLTSLHVKGLVMVDLGNPEIIRLGFPKAPGHKATLSFVTPNGAKQTLAIKGRGVVEAKAIAPADARIVIPELIRMKEFYGDDVKSRVDQCPGVISIPRNAIHSVKATELTSSRYTFVRTDTGEEVNSFRPRKVADAINIELTSIGTLKLNDGKVSIPLDTARELRVQYTPNSMTSTDAFAEHFQHYFPYIERPAAFDFDVAPRKLGSNSPTPRVGHHFMMLDIGLCSLVAVP